MPYYGYKPAEQAIQIGDNTIVSADIADGSIVNADINSSAAIAMSKTQLTAGTGITLSTNTLNVDAAQTQITSVGTIATGVWNGTKVASAYLDDDTAHLSTTQTFTGAKTFTGETVIDGGTGLTGGWGRSLTLEHDFPMIAFRSEYSTDAWGAIGYDNSTGMKFFVNSSDGDIPTNGTLGLAILDDGKVGVGCTPTTKLQVKAGSTEEDVILLEDNSGTDIGAIRIHGGAFMMKGKSSTAPIQLQTHDGYEDIEVAPDGFIKFETAGSERLRIASDGLVTIGTSGFGSAGTTLKQLGTSWSTSTYWDTTNTGTFTGMAISNPHGDAGTGAGIQFSHGASSSGVSYMVSRSERATGSGGDRSSLHFGTRGSDGVARRMLIGDDGVVQIIANSDNKASLNVIASGSGSCPNDAKIYASKNNASDWTFKADAGADDYGYTTNGAGSYALYVTNHSASGAATFRVEYDGDILAANTSIASISDRRLKKEITNASSQWDDIKALNFVNYKWKKSTGMDDSIKYLGLVADEVESVSPGLIKIDAQPKEDIEAGVEDPEYKTVKYSIVWMKAVKALQEAMAKIETLEAKVEALENA